MRSLACMVAVIAMTVGFGSGVAAQQRQIEEIVVTATKREESIQDVPIAVSAYTGEDLEARGVTDLYGLQQVSPSIAVYSSNSTSNGGTVRIRGIGTTGNNPGLESAVGTFVDGIYRSRSGIAFNDLVDVERIEVLRGPQGTLFGKNTSAGALNIITKKPEFETGGMLEVTAGNLDTQKVKGSITGPVTDTLAYRLAGSYHKRDDGFYEDVATGKEYDIRDRWMLKGQLLWEPNDKFDARLIVDYSEKQEDCCPAAYYIVSSGVRAALEFANPNAFLTETPDDRDIGVNYDPYEDSEDGGFSLEINYDLDAFGGSTLTSITGYRDFSVDRSQDWDFGNTDLAAAPGQDIHETFENWSQEFRLAGSTDQIDWLFGAFVYSEKLDTDERLAFGTHWADYWAYLLTGGGLVAAPGGSTFDELRALDVVNQGYSADWSTDTDGFAIFTHNKWNVTQDLTLTLGLRYIEEEKKGTAIINGMTPLPENASDAEVLAAVTAANEPYCGANLTYRLVFAFACDNASYKRKRKDDAISGTFSIGYAINDNQNVYATYSRGFKAGGLNHDQQGLDASAAWRASIGVGSAGVADGVEWEEEKVDAYEIGYKAQFLDNRLTMNTAVFLMDIQDFQLNTFTGTGFIVGNPGDVESSGVELETAWTATDWLYLVAGATYTDARYDDDVEGASTGGGGSIGGRTLTHSPYWQANASAFVEHQLGDSNLIGFGNVNYSYRGDHNTGSDLDLEKIQKGYDLWNVQAGIRTADDRWEFKVFCTNCADEDYNLLIFDAVLQGGSYSTFLGAPRMWGGSIKASF